MNSVPNSGTKGSPAVCMVSRDLILDRRDQDLQHGLPARGAASCRPRVSAKQTTASAAIRHQVVTTGSVIGTGPRWNSDGRDQRGFGHGQTFQRTERDGAREQKAEERAEQRHGAGLRNQDEADPCQEQPAEVQRHGWAEGSAGEVALDVQPERSEIAAPSRAPSRTNGAPSRSTSVRRAPLMPG